MKKTKFTALLLCMGFSVIAPVHVRGTEGTTTEALQQNKKVTGQVTDEQGEPIIGASVKIVGTTQGTVTDLDGNFTFDAPSKVTLEISYIGFLSQKVAATPGSPVRVTLHSDEQALDEVVVVGFATQKKVNLTGSVGVATAKDIESRPVTSATQALQGVVPGLNLSTNNGELTKSMSINVRGTGTIGSSSGSPLILIDGMEGDINTVNPQDIESVSVLKDAAASSIYGSRAPFGVILVTTKKGSKGKTTVNYNNSFRWSSPMGLPESMDSYTFAVYMNEALTNSGKSARFSDVTMQKMLDYQAGKLTGGLDVRANDPTQWEDVWAYGYANTDIYKDLYKSSTFSMEHAISASGGTDKVTYYASFNYLNQGGMLKIADDGLNRYNLTGKVNAELASWLKFNFATRFTRNDVHQPRQLGDSFYRMYGRQNWPNIPNYDPNGNLFGYNIMELVMGGTTRTQTDRHYYQGAFILEPVKNWVTNVEVNYSICESDTKTTQEQAWQTGPTGTKIYRISDTYLYQNKLKENYYNTNVYTTYSFSLNESHNFKAMAGMQYENMKQNDLNVTKYGLIDENMPEFDLTTGLLYSGASRESTVHGYDNEWTTLGYFGRLNYDYKGRYLVEMNIRNDGTSRFRSGRRWQWSPSFSLGWNVAQEKFWESLQDKVNTLKPRFSYGYLGNQNTNSWYPTYRSMVLSILGGSWLQNGSKPNTSYVSSLISEALTWEKVRTWDIGLDFGAFNNRLTGTLDYYTRYTKDMLGPANELPATLGISAPQTNNCDLKTRGWEMQLTWRDRLKNGFSYGVTASLSDQTTYIDSYPNNATQSIDTYIAGRKLGEIWGFETIGIAKSDEEMNSHLATTDQSNIGTQWAAGDIMYRDLDGDGKITTGSSTLDDHGDLKVLGDSNPHYFFSLDLTAAWKGFDFRAFFQGVAKRDFWPGGDATTNNDNAGGYFWGVRGNQNEWHIRGFVQHNDYFRAEATGLEGYEIAANLDSYFPRPLTNAGDGQKNQRVQSRYMQNAGYCRLKNLQLGYTLPNILTNRIGIDKCRLFVSAENVFTITSLFDVFDPETCTGGVGGNVYPLSKTWSFGLSVTL